jgi:alcohol dehydrogenase
MSIAANWNYPTTVRFGAGRIAELPEALEAAGIARPLLVTDAGLAGLAVTQDTLALLKDAGIEAGLFCDVKPNPVSRPAYRCCGPADMTA